MAFRYVLKPGIVLVFQIGGAFPKQPMMPAESAAFTALPTLAPDTSAIPTSQGTELRLPPGIGVSNMNCCLCSSQPEKGPFQFSEGDLDMGSNGLQEGGVLFVKDVLEGVP